MSHKIGLAYYNQKALQLEEHYDPFLQKRDDETPIYWSKQIPQGPYKLFNGTTQRTNIWRGGLGEQSGLLNWKPVEASRKPNGADAGVDVCNDTPQTFTYAVETMQYTGFKTSWQSLPICMEEWKYIDMAKEQLALVAGQMVFVGMTVRENFAREMYVKQAVDAGKTMILCEGGIDFIDDSSVRFTYDPFTSKDITFSSTLKISAMNTSILDALYDYLGAQCPAAALSRNGGVPMFGIAIHTRDIDRMVHEDKELMESYRYSKPELLIDGFTGKVRELRNYAVVHDANQMRFKIKSVSATTTTATRVDVKREGAAVTIGNKPEVNPDYVNAELAIAPILLNEAYMIQVPGAVASLGGKYAFGAAPGYNGEINWINEYDPTFNRLRNTGYYYMRFEKFPRPLKYAGEVIAMLYRRCPQTWATGCEVQLRDDVATGSVAVAQAAVAADVDAVNFTVTLTLAKKLSGGIGDAVSMVDSDAGVAVSAIIAEDALAPTYVFAKATAFTAFGKWGTTATVTMA